MAHRGPDDAGLVWSDDGRVGLAHRRLAILDLSPAGHQPMHSEDAHRAIVFNGEIYNFAALREELMAAGERFRSHSDTEVILAAYRVWGPACLDHFNGMFAFAIHDTVRRIIFLARDRAGEKPLFLHLANGTLRFASELKALLADPVVPRVIDPEGLDCYLAMGFVPGDRCLLAGFNKLPPGHAAEFCLDEGSLRTWRYWALPAAEAGSMDDRGVLDSLEQLLEESVRRQMVADVPVGVLLSGGVDSSLITAMAVRASGNVKTFTIRFPGHGTLDETEHARLIARHFGTDHTELEAQPATADLLPILARQFDEPIVDSSMIPTFLVSRLVRQRCTVALGGDGGDELFGGYEHHRRLLWMQKTLGNTPRLPRRAVAWAAERLLPAGFKGRNWLQGLGADLDHDLPLIASYFDATTRRKLLAHRSNWPFDGEGIRQIRVPDQPDLLQRITRMDFADYLAEDILVKVDRASMLNSLEVRAPFLDVRLIEFAFSQVPSRLRATSTDGKILLKQLAARVLPPEFDRRRKQGFSIPLAHWLAEGAFRDLFHDVLLSGTGSFEPRAVRRLWQDQQRGYANSERLFALVLFELWRHAYQISF
jgi:asparagine synthase (glutamine-hydrolysing)